MVALKTLIFTKKRRIALVGRGSDAFPLGLADGYAPLLPRSNPLLLLCRSVHHHWPWNASSHRRAGLPGEIGTLSVMPSSFTKGVTYPTGEVSFSMDSSS